jgi:predicted N-formylglutamate amidohydrolase
VRVAAEDVFLALEDGPAVRTENTDGASPVLLVCEHAANRIPRTLGTLDLDPSVLQSHVAWDPGAYEVALLLARSLDATLISSRFSRLVYDVNRPPDSPQAIRAASEIYDIPANQNLSAGERNARIEAIYRPFHDAIAERIEARAAKGRPSVLVTIHSFTPIYYGQERQVELGILHDRDARLADCLLGCGARFTTLSVQRNQPYGPEDGVTHTLAKHALAHGLLNAMIEIRNDLIRTPAQQARVAEALAGMIQCALTALGVPTAKPPPDPE